MALSCSEEHSCNRQGLSLRSTSYQFILIRARLSDVMKNILFILILMPTLLLGENDQHFSLKTVAADSDLVIVGTITAIAYSSVTSGDDTIYVSDLTVSVNETLKGTTSSPITVRIPGGTIGGVTFKSSAFPYTAYIGARAVYFLSPVSSGRRTLIHTNAGYYELKSDNTVFDQRGLTLAIIRSQVS